MCEWVKDFWKDCIILEYGDIVKIVKGFHKGRKGIVIDEGRIANTYDVKFEAGEIGHSISCVDMEFDE